MKTEAVVRTLHDLVARAIINGEERSALAIAELARDLSTTTLEIKAKPETPKLTLPHAQAILPLQVFDGMIERAEDGELVDAEFEVSARTPAWWRVKIAQLFFPEVLASGTDTFKTSRLYDWAAVYMHGHPEEFTWADQAKTASGSPAWRNRISVSLQAMVHLRTILKIEGQKTSYRIPIAA